MQKVSMYQSTMTAGRSYWVPVYSLYWLTSPHSGWTTGWNWSWEPRLGAERRVKTPVLIRVGAALGKKTNYAA